MPTGTWRCSPAPAPAASSTPGSSLAHLTAGDGAARSARPALPAPWWPTRPRSGGATAIFRYLPPARAALWPLPARTSRTTRQAGRRGTACTAAAPARRPRSWTPAARSRCSARPRRAPWPSTSGTAAPGAAGPLWAPARRACAGFRPWSLTAPGRPRYLPRPSPAAWSMPGRTRAPAPGPGEPRWPGRRQAPRSRASRRPPPGLAAGSWSSAGWPAASWATSCRRAAPARRAGQAGSRSAAASWAARRAGSTPAECPRRQSWSATCGWRCPGTRSAAGATGRSWAAVS
jgi:hypothetical protein